MQHLKISWCVEGTECGEHAELTENFLVVPAMIYLLISGCHVVIDSSLAPRTLRISAQAQDLIDRYDIMIR